MRDNVPDHDDWVRQKQAEACQDEDFDPKSKEKDRLERMIEDIMWGRNDDQ